MKKSLFGLVILLVIAAPAWGNTTVYTDFTAWGAAVGPFTSYDFTSGLPSGITFNSQGGGNAIASGCCAFSGTPVWHDVVSPNIAFTTFTLGTAATAFGGLWDLAGPGGPGVGLNVFADGVFVGLIDHNTFGTFWGFTSTTPFTILTLYADSQGSGIETYEISNLYANQVPEPASLLLFGSGILALARKLRKS
jgi:PEP-CTERM motif